MSNFPTDFNPGNRYLFVYGKRSSDAEFDVCIDGKPIDNPFADIEQFDLDHPDLGPAQYSFSTENSFLGAIPIKVKMLKGSLTLTRARVFYPAKITNNEGSDSFGYYGMFQPIGDPKWMVRINDQLQTLEEQDQHLTGEVHYKITAGDTLEYYHVMIDGPDYWWIGYKIAEQKYVVDQTDPNISFAVFDNYDRLNILKNQLLTDYKNS